MGELLTLNGGDVSFILRLMKSSLIRQMNESFERRKSHYLTHHNIDGYVLTSSNQEEFLEEIVSTPRYRKLLKKYYSQWSRANLKTHTIKRIDYPNFLF